MSGSNRRNWLSVSAWPEPKSPTSARSAGVHIAVSKQKPPITPPDSPGSARQTTPLVPLQTGSKQTGRGKRLSLVVEASDRVMNGTVESAGLAKDAVGALM